jgi:long-chain acyl-CoA synthetase
MVSGFQNELGGETWERLNQGTGEVAGRWGEIWRLKTSPQLLKENASMWPDEPAMRKKRYGIWNTYTWKEYFESVKYFALGLLALGFNKNEKIAIIGDNDPEWWFSQLGAESLGGVGLGIFIDCIPSEIEYFILNSEATIVAAKDQEQCDKLLEIREKVPRVKKLIFWEPKGMSTYNDEWLMEFSEVLEQGKAYEQNNPNVFDQLIEEGEIEDIACLSYTSGTTGLPKAAMMSYRNLIMWNFALWQNYPAYRGEDYFSFLCPAWAVDQIVGFVGCLEQGIVVNFPESPETVLDDAREISSVIELAGARMWEERYRDIHTKIHDADLLKKATYKFAISVGYKYSDIRREGKSPSRFLKVLHKIADWVCLHQLRDRLGYVRARVCLVAGAMMSPELFRFFQAIGIPLYTYFGLSEVGFVSMQREGAMKLGSAGKILPGRDVKISEKGEVLIKTSNGMMFRGYFNNEEATRKSFAGEWYQTGDAGYIDEEGYFFFMDRLSEMMALKNGTKFSATYIESELRCSRYIADALVVGQGRDYVSALIQIDLKNVGQWAELNHIAYNTFVDLAQKQPVYDLIAAEIRSANERIPEESRIKAFANLHKEFDPDEAEMTRTRKLKRAPLEGKYQEIIDGIYGKKEEIEVHTEVKYRDGRMGSVEATVKVKEL